MSTTSGAGQTQPKPLTWTRAGFVRGTWGPYETFESLVFTPMLQGQVQKLAMGFMSCQDFCAKAKIPWRRGAFVFGPPGAGKSATTRAIALVLGWPHVTIPSHEVLDSHHLARALNECAAVAPAVIVLENVDEIFKRIPEAAFFDTFDLISERTDGVFWIATSKRPEEVPKTLLVRPGRFEESVRVGGPSDEVKKKFYETYLEPFLASGNAAAKAEHLAILTSNQHLTFAHLNEMRLLVAKVLMDGEPDKLAHEFEGFAKEQIIGWDRWGGPGSQAIELAERVRTADPRLLVSALYVTDAFKKIVEMTVSNASEALLAAQAETEK